MADIEVKRKLLGTRRAVIHQGIAMKGYLLWQPMQNGNLQTV
jgi:hypothetical protein